MTVCVCAETALPGGGVESRVSCLEPAARQHQLVCCLQELGGLLLRLGTTASSLLREGSTGLTHTCSLPLTHTPCAEASCTLSPPGHAALLPSPPGGLRLSGRCLEPALCCRGDAFPGFPAAGPLLPAAAVSEVCSRSRAGLRRRCGCAGVCGAALPPGNTPRQELGGSIHVSIATEQMPTRQD